jgi:glycosyltransferase involved in cell wall biosynthesis
MHVAFWSPAWPIEKYNNGIITYVHWMKRELERQGHRVSVFTRESDCPVPDPAVHVVKGRPFWDRVKRKLLGRPKSTEQAIFDYSATIAEQIQRLHRRDPIDIVEMEESFGWFADVAARTRIPVLVKLHGPAFLSLVGSELSSPFGVEKIRREGEALRRSAVIISPSQRTLSQTVERYGLTPKHQHHVFNPLTMDPDTPLWRLKTSDRNTLLFVGRFDLRKGADIALQAFLLALQRRSDLRLIFVGPDNGLLMADGTLQRFHAYCDSVFPKSLRDRVDYRGRMANREIAQLRTQAAMTLVASRWENQGYTVLEAMYQGCPVVSSDAGGSPESVIDRATGRLARSEDPHDFADKICSVLDDPEGAEALGQAARRHVIANHSAAKVAEETLAIYREAVATCVRS